MDRSVTVIITTYNYGRFIAGAVESVLAQTRPADEVIVVDDGSTDDTAAIVARYADRGVRCISTANGGCAAARNVGIRASSGELVAFLDSDDRWLPDKLQKQLEHLARYPQAALVSGSEYQVYIDQTKPTLLLRRAPVGAANLYRQTLVENIVGNSSLVLLRRECFARVGLFDETLQLGQDWDMWIRIAREFMIGVVDGELINFTKHGQSLTAGQLAGRAASNRRIQRRHISQVKSPLQRAHLTLMALSMTYYYAGATAVDDPLHRTVALRLALLAFILSPGYKTQLKAGVLIRAAFGRATFDRLNQLKQMAMRAS